MRASAAGETSRVPNPGRVVDTRHRNTALFALVAAAIVIVMGVGAYVIGSVFSGSDEDKKPTAATEQKPASNPQLVPHKDRNGRFTVSVPAGWARTVESTYVDYVPPTDPDVRLRLLVEKNGSTTPETAIGAAESYQRRQETKGETSNFRTVAKGATDRKLDGQDTWEWEWAFTSKAGQDRHVLWRNTVVNGRSYSVYLAAPRESFDKYRGVLDAVTPTFRFSGS
jgi:hypothetical protein